MTEVWATRLAGVVPEDVEHHPDLTHLSPAADVLQAYWRTVGTWSPADWVLQLVVLRDGEPIGLQALEGKDFAVRREVDTHSWLVPPARGQGHGKAMRCAVLSLAFDHLGATAAATEAVTDNVASLGVSRALGYVDSGTEKHADGRVMQHLRLDAWTAPEPVEVEGLTECLPLLGL